MNALSDRLDPFMEKIVLSLLPFFIATAASLQDARGAILDALASYGTRTQAEMAEAAQILALGLSTLESLAESAADGTSVTMRLRLRGSANALTRSKKQCQQALSASMATEVAEPEPIAISGEPEADLGAAVLHARAMAQEAQRQAAALNPTASPAPHPAATPPTMQPKDPPMTARPQKPVLTKEQRNKVLWASVMGQVIGDILPNDTGSPRG